MFQVVSMSVLLAWAGLGGLAFLLGAIRVRAVRRAVQHSQSAVDLEVATLSSGAVASSLVAPPDVRSSVPDLLAG